MGGALSGGRRVRHLTVPAFAKLNLGLEVLGVRGDGYHELRTIFQTVDLKDDILLELRPRSLSLSCDDPRLPIDGGNLALRAALLLQRYSGIRAGVRIAIAKRIPVAGGLGGGSSDAAAVLLALDRLWGLGLGRSGLLPLARRLGADVPFFLFGGTALGIARGDEIYPLATRVSAHAVVVEGERPLATPAVFARVDQGLTPRENSNNIFRFISSYGERGADALSILSNDLEAAALEEAPDLVPRVRSVRGTLSAAGAKLASLSGSGASYFGLFDRVAQAKRAVEELEAAGFRAFRTRTLSAEQYRARWRRALGPGVSAG